MKNDPLVAQMAEDAKTLGTTGFLPSRTGAPPERDDTFKPVQKWNAKHVDSDLVEKLVTLLFAREGLSGEKDVMKLVRDRLNGGLRAVSDPVRLRFSFNTNSAHATNRSG